MTDAVLPAWIVLPISVGLMMLVSAHMSRLKESHGPASRTRIRIANGWVMLFALGFTAAGFSLVSSNLRPRLFFIVWAVSLVLITTSVMLAMLDMMNTLRLMRRVRVRIRVDAAGAVAPMTGPDDTQDTDGDIRAG